MNHPAKTWTGFGQCFIHHAMLFQNMMRVYIAPFHLTGPQMECLYLSVNSVNKCSYCSDLHLNMGRLSGLEDFEFINSTGPEECAITNLKLSDEVLDQLHTYAQKFGVADGNSSKLTKDKEALVLKFGHAKVASIDALCWYLHWGSWSGVTLCYMTNCDNGYKITQIPSLFQCLFVGYYSPLFLLIKITSGILSLLPSNIPKVQLALTYVLYVVSSIWILPLGLVSTLWTSIMPSAAQKKTN